MPLPISEIGELTVLAIAPYVRALLAGLGEGAIKGAGTDVYQTAKALYQQLWESKAEPATAEAAIKQLAAAPGRADVKEAVKATLIALLGVVHKWLILGNTRSTN